MISLDSLQAQLAPTLATLEAERARQHARVQKTALWCAGGGALGALALLAVLQQVTLWLLAPLAAALAVYLFVRGGATKEYARGFKGLVLPEIVRHFGDLSFSGESGIGEDEFNLPRLYESPDRFSSEDLIEGRIGATTLRFCECHAERREERRDSQGRTTTHYVTFFRGLFFVVDFNKRFGAVTAILPESWAERGPFGRKLQALGGKLSGRGELVSLENPDFERVWKVFSTDQTEARYLLSSRLMERLLALRARYNCDVSAAFLGGALYLAIETNQNWFEPPALGQPLNWNALGAVVTQLQTATALVEDLDLNTRIWTKA